MKKVSYPLQTDFHSSKVHAVFARLDPLDHSTTPSFPLILASAAFIVSSLRSCSLGRSQMMVNTIEHARKQTVGLEYGRNPQAISFSW